VDVTKRIRNALIAGVLLCASATLAGCATPPTHRAPASTVSRVAPIVAELSALDGQTVTLPKSTVLDITVPAGESVGWTVTFGTQGIGLFQPGSERGGVVTNPGIVPLRTGTTTVTLTRPAAQRATTFTLNVVAAE
jgi:hypothetical protein